MVKFLSRMDVDISESLCGMSRAVKTLDGRSIVLTTAPGEIIKQADCKMIKGEGMPTHRVCGNKYWSSNVLNIAASRIRSIKEN